MPESDSALARLGVPPGAVKARLADVVLEGGATVDARASDGIMLALVTGAPLRVSPNVFDTEPQSERLARTAAELERLRPR